MFDLIPFTGARRKVPHVDRDPDLIGELLQFHLPQSAARGIAPTPIGRDQYRVRLWIARFAHLPPPAPDGLDRKLGGVVIDPHTDPTAIVCRIVHALGTDLAPPRVWKIMGTHVLRLSLGLILTSPSGKSAH